MNSALARKIETLPPEEKVKLAEAAAEVEMRKCRRLKTGCLYFIQNYVHIEDKDILLDPDNPGVARKFILWADQAKTLLLFLTKRLIIILKARQLGLTWLALAYAVWRMLFFPGYTVNALSKKENPDAKELVRRIRFILEHLPPWMARERGPDVPKDYPGVVWETSVLKVVIHHPDRVAKDGTRTKQPPSTFQSFSAAPDSGRSFTANLVILDEWAFQPYAEEIWDSAYPTINRPTGGQVIGLSTGKKGTFFEKVWLMAKTGLNRFVTVFLPWWADPRRDQAWYEDTKANMPNTYRREYPATEEDAFAVGEGAFFPEWRPEVHICAEHFEPPKGWPIIGGYDPGFASRACFKWYTVTPEGWLIGFREYYPTQTTDMDQYREIKRRSKYADGTPMRFEYVVADTDAWTKSRDTGVSTAERFGNPYPDSDSNTDSYLAEQAEHREFGYVGLPMIKASKDLENGWRRLHEWLKPIQGPDGRLTAKLTFTKDCANTIRTYPACEQSKTNPEDISRDSEHHPQDVDRYVVMSRPEPAEPEDTALKELERRFGKDSPEYQIWSNYLKEQSDDGGIDPSELV